MRSTVPQQYVVQLNRTAGLIDYILPGLGFFILAWCILNVATVMWAITKVPNGLNIPVILLASVVVGVLGMRNRDSRISLLLPWLLFVVVHLTIGMLVDSSNMTRESILREILKPLLAWLFIPGIILFSGIMRYPRAVGWILGAAVVATTLVNLLAITQTHIVHSMGLYFDRPAGIWLNANLCGACLSLIFIYYFTYGTNRLFAWSIQGLCIFSLVLSTSRSAILSLGVAFLITSICARKFNNIVKMTFVGILAIFFIYAFSGYLNENQQRRITFISQVVTGDFQAISSYNQQGNARTVIWEAAIQRIKNDWDIGQGFSEQIVSMFEGGLGVHNYYLYILMTSGIISLGAFFIAFISLYYHITKVEDTTRRSIYYGFLGFLACNLMFTHSIPSMVSFNILFGVFIGLICQEKTKSQAAALKSNTMPFFPQSTVATRSPANARQASFPSSKP